MPFTPLHFGPAATIAIPLRKRLDLPVFLLANLIIDLEPLTVALFQLNVPEHAVAHSLTVGAVIGAAWGYSAYAIRRPLSGLMRRMKLSYEPARRGMIISGVLGVWSNVLLDAIIYPEIRLLYPLKGNPLFGCVDSGLLMIICALFFVPAVIFYLKAAHSASEFGNKKCE